LFLSATDCGDLHRDVTARKTNERSLPDLLPSERFRQFAIDTISMFFDGCLSSAGGGGNTFPTPASSPESHE